eukprot:12119715-Alexandrium_andersonii.AAC.1
MHHGIGSLLDDGASRPRTLLDSIEAKRVGIAVHTIHHSLEDVRNRDQPLQGVCRPRSDPGTHLPLRLLVRDVIDRTLLGDLSSERRDALGRGLLASVLSGVRGLAIAVIDDDDGGAVRRDAEAAGVAIRD